MATSQNLVSLQKKHALYRPQGTAVKVWSCRAPEILYAGPARTGKSRLWLERANLQAMKYPKCRILLVRKTRGSMSESVLQTFEDEVLPPKSPLLNGAQRSHRQDYLYPNGSRIIPAGLDNPEKVLSSEYDAIYGFESLEFTEDDYEILTSRLSHDSMGYRQIGLDCNPGPPTHWLRSGMLKNRFTVFESKHTDNPRWYNPKTKTWTAAGLEYIERLKKLTGVRRLRLYLGKWAAAEGVVFELREENICNMPVEGYPKSWRRIRVIDFGYTAPFVCQWWAIDPDGRMYRYREIYMSHRLVRDHAKQILMLSRGENIEATIADWEDAEARADLESCGIPTIPAYKDFKAGRDNMQDRLRDAGDHKPRMLFCRDALVERDELLAEISHPLETIPEFDLYIYKKKTRQAVDDKLEKEDAIDRFDHGISCARYASAYVDELGRDVIEVESDDAALLTNDGLVPAEHIISPENAGELLLPDNEIINPVNYASSDNEYVLPVR